MNWFARTIAYLFPNAHVHRVVVVFYYRPICIDCGKRFSSRPWLSHLLPGTDKNRAIAYHAHNLLNHEQYGDKLYSLRTWCRDFGVAVPKNGTIEPDVTWRDHEND